MANDLNNSKDFTTVCLKESDNAEIYFHSKHKSGYGLLFKSRERTDGLYCMGLYQCDCPSHIIIPEHINCNGKIYQIKGIASNAFERCTNLKTIDLFFVTEIRENAFRGCSELMELSSTSIESIGDNAFEGCTKLSTVAIDMVKSIGDEAFKGCMSLTTISIENARSIGDDALAECRNLKQISINNPSLLKDAEVPGDIELVHPYLNKLSEHSGQELNAPNSPGFVGFFAERAFAPIVIAFADGLDIIYPKSFNGTLYNSLRWFKNYLMSTRFGFVQSLHIFNNIGENQPFSINVFVDYEKNIVTDKREEVNADNPVFSDDSLIYLLKNDNQEFAPVGNIVEYCCKSSEPILESPFYPIIEDYLDQPALKMHHLLRYLFKEFDSNGNNEKKEYLAALHSYAGDTITNYFFIGNYGEEMDRKYSIWANVGINSANVTNQECVVAYLRQLRQFLNRLSAQIQAGIRMYKNREKAVGAAVNQVNNRNLNHNIGSHVLSKFTGDSFYRSIKDLASSDYGFHPIYKKLKIKSGQQLAYFNRYMKNRMDYLSEVTFGVPSILVSKNFYSDVFRELDQVRLLLNHISGVPEFEYEFHLFYNGKPLNEQNDIAVAFPSDVLANQAFYNIIENIIRNTAKHASIGRNKNENDCVTFTIDFSDDDDFPEYREYYCVEIDNGVKESNIESLVKEQNRQINDSILDEHNNLRTRGLGLIEMESSAAFLRQINISKIDSYIYGFNDNDEYHNDEHTTLTILRAINKGGNLGYRFFLPKPKDILFVGDWGINSNQKALFNYGLFIVGTEQFVQDMKSGKSYAHQFLVYNDSITKEAEELLSENNVCKTLLPIRKLKFNHEESTKITKILIDADKDNPTPRLKELIWNHYYKTIIKGELINPDNSKIRIDGKIDVDDEGEPVPNHVVFLNHGYNNNHQNKWSQAIDGGNPEITAHPMEAWVENLSSHSSTKLPEFQTLSIGRNPISNYLAKIENVERIKQEIFEAYHNRVVVIDERIQDHQSKGVEGSSDAKYGGPIPVSSLFKSTNVLVPDASTIPLAPKEFNQSLVEKVEEYIETNIRNAMVLIHYGILERMYKNDEDLITNKLNKWSDMAKRLVVTSGRGSHSLELPPSVCFVDLSSVLYAFVENRNKYIINYLLHQARRKNETSSVID